MKYLIKYGAAIAGAGVIGAAYYLPSETYLGFISGWLFLIPAAILVYFAYGLREYMKDRKNRIMVSIKPTEAMNALARREAELEREKKILYEEFSKR